MNNPTIEVQNLQVNETINERKEKRIKKIYQDPITQISP